MAENEYLDLVRSPRWRRLCDRSAAGAVDDDIVQAIVRNLYRTMRRVARQIPLQAMLVAALQGDDVRAMARQP